MYCFFRFLTVKHIFGRFLQKDQVQNYRIFVQQQKDRETNVMPPSLDEYYSGKCNKCRTLHNKMRIILPPSRGA